MSLEEKRAETLCFNNITVKNTFRTLKKKLKKLGITDSELYYLIDDGIETLKVMKKQGEKIEARCREYLTACEGLGFQRIKKHKRTRKVKST